MKTQIEKPEAAEVSIQYKEKELTSIQQFLGELLREHTTVVLTVPIDSVLSPFVKASQFKMYSCSNDCVVIANTSSLVTILINNSNNIDVTLLNRKQQEEPQFIVLPKKSAVSSIKTSQSQQLKISTLDAFQPLKNQSEVHQFSNCSIEEVVSQTLGNGKRDVLYVNQQD